jgi:hypothetical protein
MNLQKGLVGHWTMDDADTSSGTLYDRSAYDNHGTLDSGINTGVSGKVGEAYSFTGETLSIPAIEPDTITISSWVNPDNNSDDMRWARLDYSNSNNKGMLLRYDSGNFQLLHGDGTTIVYTFDISVYNIAGNWIHTVCTVKSNGDTEFWINGVLEDTNTSNGLNWDSEGGSFEISETGRFSGQIDDFRIYNRELSEDEVNALYQMRSPRRQTNELDKGLVGHWTMDDADTSGGMLYDSSAYGNHGSNSSGTTTGSSGLIGQSYTFDGIDANVDIQKTATDLKLGQPFTISIWLYVNSGAGQGWVIGNYDSNNGGGAIVYDRSEIDGISLYDGIDGQTFTTHTIEQDTWHHIVLTGSSDTYELFIDDSSFGSNATTEAVFTNTSYTFRIGKGYSDADTAIDGRIDSLRLYNRVLSANEVSALYQMRNQRNAYL